MIVFAEDSHRDLKGKEAAASIARPAGAGKKEEEAGASEPRVPLACLFPIDSMSTAEVVAGKKRKASAAEKKRKEAVSPESGDGAPKKEDDSLFKEGEMLKLREDYWDAMDLGLENVPGALDRWAERKLTQEPAVKKKKVVRIITPNAYMDDIIENPVELQELSDEEMAKCPEKYRESYAIAKIFNAKQYRYHQALIRQYRAFGFAYDEKEVTDDDEKEVTQEEEVKQAEG